MQRARRQAEEERKECESLAAIVTQRRRPSVLLRERPVGVEGLVGELLQLVEPAVENLLDMVVEIAGHEEKLARSGAPHGEQVGIVEEDVWGVGIIGAPDHG